MNCSRTPDLRFEAIRLFEGLYDIVNHELALGSIEIHGEGQRNNLKFRYKILSRVICEMTKAPARVVYNIGHVCQGCCGVGSRLSYQPALICLVYAPALDKSGVLKMQNHVAAGAFEDEANGE